TLEEGKRRSIHQPMRVAIETIRALYELVAIQMHDVGVKAVIRNHQSCQTSPLFRTTGEIKKKQEIGARSPVSKRVRNVGENAGEVANEVETANATPEAGTPELKQRNVQEDKEAGNPWKKVTRKEVKKVTKELPKPKQKGLASKKARPDALVIKTTGEVTYAEILRKVKTDGNLQGLGEAVTKIRRTQQGELLIELGDAGENLTMFNNLITETLGEAAEIRSLSHRVEI
ncbi:hypothetical protein KR044_006941, partial [Drosophila immigrans]